MYGRRVDTSHPSGFEAGSWYLGLGVVLRGPRHKLARFTHSARARWPMGVPRNPGSEAAYDGRGSFAELPRSESNHTFRRGDPNS